MNVFCNGFPKSGNHALVKAVQLIGHPCEVNHRSCADGLPPNVTHHILVTRDPRNIIVSWLRFNREAVTPGTFLSKFRRFQRGTLDEDMSDFEWWLGSAHVVKYEDLVANAKAMVGIAVYLGTPYIAGAWENLEGHTVTYNKVHSDYRNIWTNQVQDDWSAEGGDDLLKRWGY